MSVELGIFILVSFSLSATLFKCWHKSYNKQKLWRGSLVITKRIVLIVLGGINCCWFNDISFSFHTAINSGMCLKDTTGSGTNNQGKGDWKKDLVASTYILLSTFWAVFLLHEDQASFLQSQHWSPVTKKNIEIIRAKKIIKLYYYWILLLFYWPWAYFLGFCKDR